MGYGSWVMVKVWFGYVCGSVVVMLLKALPGRNDAFIHNLSSTSFDLRNHLLVVECSEDASTRLMLMFVHFLLAFPYKDAT